MTNRVLARLSPKRQRTPKPWKSCINTPANTRANPPQSATSRPTTGRGSKTERPATESGKGSGTERETWTGHDRRPPNASCPLTPTWDTRCSQGSTTCLTPQVPVTFRLFKWFQLKYFTFILSNSNPAQTKLGRCSGIRRRCRDSYHSRGTLEQGTEPQMLT